MIPVCHYYCLIFSRKQTDDFHGPSRAVQDDFFDLIIFYSPSLYLGSNKTGIYTCFVTTYLIKDIRAIPPYIQWTQELS